MILGSFGTVVAHRVPLGKNIVSGRSRCPHCDHTITAIENVPVFSYLVQRGRCRGCGAPISIRYPLTELAVGLLFGAAAWKFGLSVEGVVFAAFFWVLVVLTAIDFEHHLLPNKIVYPSALVGAVGLVAAALTEGDPDRLWGALAGAGIFGGLLFTLAFIYPAGMGLGDVKLAFVLGAFLGYLEAPGLVFVAMFLAFVGGGVVGIIVLVAKKGDRKTLIAFGPFLSAGTVTAVFVGQRLLDSYLGRI